MKSEKIQLVYHPEEKNVNLLMIMGTGMIVLPVLIVLYNTILTQIPFEIMDRWAEIIFFLGGFFCFLRIYQIKKRKWKYFVEFSEHTLTYRNRKQEQQWIDYSDINKVDIGEEVAAIELKGGKK